VDPEILALALLIAFLASLCSSLTGFGFALVMTPLLTLAWDVELAVATTTLVAFLNNGALLVEARGHLVPSRVSILLVGFAIGLPAGIYLLELLDADTMKILVSTTVLVTGVALFFTPNYEIRGGANPIAVAAGAVSGVIGPVTSMNGPPIVIYLLGRHPAMDEFRSTILAYFLPTGVITVATFVILGRITGDVLLVTVVCVPAVLLGAVAGAWCRQHLSQERFRVVVLALLVFSSLAVLLSAIV
jgi:uncharacterized membrane protein YfcA